MSPLTLTDLHSGSEQEDDYIFRFNQRCQVFWHCFRYRLCLESLIQFVTCLFLFVLLSVALISSLSPAVDWCSSLSLICCWLWLCLLSFTFFLPSLFSGLDCFQEPHGVMPDLSLSVQLSMCLSSCLCLVHSFLSISARVSPCICSSLPLWAKCFWSNIIFCYLLFLSSRPQSRSKMLAFTLFVLCNCVCVTSVFGLHKCNYLFSTYGIYFMCVSRNNIQMHSMVTLWVRNILYCQRLQVQAFIRVKSVPDIHEHKGVMLSVLNTKIKNKCVNWTLLNRVNGRYKAFIFHI